MSIDSKDSTPAGTGAARSWRTNPYLRDPFIHFLIIGLVLFLTVSALSDDQGDNVIVVDDDALLTHMQYRSKAFNDEAARAAYERLSHAQKTALVNEYVREEALFREAKKMGFENSDFIIRRRLIQKMDFIAEAGIAVPSPSPEDLRAYYAENRQDYADQARASFTHVYFDVRKSDTPEHAFQRAQAALAELVNAPGLEAAQHYGDWFPHQSSYANSAYEQVLDAVGVNAASLIFTSETPLNRWVGPVVSDYGVHLLFISERKAPSVAPFAEVQGAMAARMEREALDKRKSAYFNEVVTRYEVIMDVSYPEKTESEE